MSFRKFICLLLSSFLSLSITLNVCGMGEYGMKKQKSAIRPIASYESKNRQLKGFNDNRERPSFQKTNIVTQMGGIFSKPISTPIINTFEATDSQIIAGRSTASVGMDVQLTDPTQKIFYEIKWDANVVPGGNHLGQIVDTASPGFVIDRAPNGSPIADGLSEFSAAHFSDSEFGERTHFFYIDDIQQRELNNGSWWFRIRITDAQNKDLVSQVVEIDWRH